MSFLGSFFKQSKKQHYPEANHKPSPPQLRYEKGSFIGDKYEVYGELGHGGFGVVYKAYSRETASVYALKTFRDDFLEDTEIRKLFCREANVWVELERHPYIVRAYFVDEVSGRLYIAMEYIAPSEEGLNSLEGYLERQPPDLSQSLRWAIQFCYGMEYAYSKGLRCHRDIKPANIMITQDKTVKISDFGLASILDVPKTMSRTRLIIQEGKIGLSGSIMEGRGCGTPTHMPPEQFTNAASCDQRSDIYAFGIVLYQMATGGRFPFLAPLPKNSSEEEQARFSREMYRLHSRGSIPKIRSPIFSVIQRCLEKESDQRYQTFKELRMEIEPILKHLTGEMVSLPSMPDFDAMEWSDKGVSLYNLGHPDEAVNCYDRALEINPQEPMIWVNKGNSLCSLGRFDEAVNCYNRALGIDPQEAAAWVSKGFAFNNLYKFDEAIHCCDAALKINPQLAIAWYNKGCSLRSLGRFDESIKCYDKALEINPQDPMIWVNKGNSLDDSGHSEEAIKSYDIALKINPQEAWAWYNNGVCLDGLGYSEKAIKSYDKALEINPLYADAWYNKASIEEELDRKQEAIRSYQKFIELAPAKYAKEIEAAKQCLRKLEGT